MYVVVENTPGYLPEDDDPAKFDDLGEAREYAKERLESLVEFILEGQDYEYGEDGVDVSGDFSDDTSVYVSDKARTHDLGRVIEILEVEADFGIRNHGSLYTLHPRNDAAGAWVDEHIARDEDGLQWFGDGLVVEPRYLLDIVQGIEGDGLTVETLR